MTETFYATFWFTCSRHLVLLSVLASRVVLFHPQTRFPTPLCHFSATSETTGVIVNVMTAFIGVHVVLLCKKNVNLDVCEDSLYRPV